MLKQGVSVLGVKFKQVVRRIMTMEVKTHGKAAFV